MVKHVRDNDLIPNFINDGNGPTKNKTDFKPYSLTLSKLPIDSTSFSGNPTNNEFDLLPSVSRETTDISKIDVDEIYSES